MNLVESRVLGPITQEAQLVKLSFKVCSKTRKPDDFCACAGKEKAFLTSVDENQNENRHKVSLCYNFTAAERLLPECYEVYS